MKIVAIGGGSFDINSDTKPFSLKKTCDKIVELSGKKCPRLVYLGFNIRADYYFGCIKKIFGERNCQCEYLRFNEFSNEKTVEGKLSRANIIILPGGNTLSYMRALSRFHIKEQIIEKVKSGTVLAGISAGAIMCFEFGHSDSKTKLSRDGYKVYTKVKGLALEKGLISPHFSQSDRKFDIKRVLFSCKKDMVAFGIDENASLIINNDNYEIITENNNAKVLKLFIKNKELCEVTLNNSGRKTDLYQM